MKIKRLISALVLMFALILPAFGADKKTENDNFINDSVRQKLAGDAVVKGGAIEVEVKDGIVTLKGRVQESRQKSKAESLAKKVKGVKSVVNDLQIVPQ